MQKGRVETIGIPKEVKDHEYRVGATPFLVKEMVDLGFRVFVEHNAGVAIGFTDEDYRKAGALVVDSKEEVYLKDLILKVKEPLDFEVALMHPGQILFCFLHLAAGVSLLGALLEKEVASFAFEMVETDTSQLPILRPMSQIAGRISVQVGATGLQMVHGGRGTLLGGLPGVSPAKVTVIGGGVAGFEATKVAYGMGADVTVLDRSESVLENFFHYFEGRVKTEISSKEILLSKVTESDLVVGAVLLPGRKTPKLLLDKDIQKMHPGSVFVDISIDQGGISETSRVNTHSDPYYTVHGVVHYCVSNMPGACARTATIALSNVIKPYLIYLASHGIETCIKENPALRRSINTLEGEIFSPILREEFPDFC